MVPGRKLEKVGSGVITGVEKKRFTLDGRRFITFLRQKTFSTTKRLRLERRSMSIVTVSTVREFAKISF